MTGHVSEPALFGTWPRLRGVVPWMSLGSWPSPLEPKLLLGREVLFKREDLSAQGYAGNKIRPLEIVFGAAREAGKREIWSTGAYGSNHALAAAVHARRHGFLAGAVLWPQPWSPTAAENLEATASVCEEVRWMRSIATMPLSGLWVQGTRSAWVMPPGAATPLGAMGHAGAALELGHQLAGRAVDAIVLPVGSTCTTAGLLVGTALAHALGLLERLPRIVAVRVTPWPVTDARRIAHLAAATVERFAASFSRAGLTMPAIAGGARDFLGRVEVIGDQLGGGYGRPTPAGFSALAELLHLGLRPDTTYSAKAAAHLIERLRRDRERLVFWATKSALPLPSVNPARIAALPRNVKNWLARH